MTWRDLFFAALLAFVGIPALFFGAGIIATLTAEAIGVGRTPAGVVLGIGWLGLYAWVGVPAAMLIGRFATQMGWVGFVTAPLAGGVGGALTGLAILFLEGRDTLMTQNLFPLALVLPGALFGAFGWVALRYLRRDVYIEDAYIEGADN